MEKKRVEYVRVLVNQKEDRKQKSFFEKNKDVLGALVSIVTLLGSAYVIMVALFQFFYAQHAENYYYIEWSYFAKEDLGLAFRVSLDGVLYFIWFLQPLLPFIIERRHNHVVPATEPNWSGKNKSEIIMHCLPFFLLDILFCIYFFPIIEDTIKWYYTNNADALRLAVCILIVLIGAYLIQFIIQWHKEKKLSINLFYKTLREDFKEIFFDAKKIFILVICSLILYFVLPANLFGGKAIQINNHIIVIIIIIMMIKILSFILAQLFYFGKLSSKPEKYTGGQPEEQKDNNGCKDEQEQSKELNLKQIGAVLLLVLTSAIIFYSFLYVFQLNLAVLNPRNKKFYEIVQLWNTPDCENSDEQKASDSNLQAVILHRGSQILLMNGTIDDGEVEIKSPKDITSSSNLYLDISSYEIRDADKYIFYRKRFASVKRKYGDYLLDKDDEEKK